MYTQSSSRATTTKHKNFLTWKSLAQILTSIDKHINLMYRHTIYLRNVQNERKNVVLVLMVHELMQMQNKNFLF